ncbi:MAG: SPOR domain-containing protein [Chromatiaceae bacterium]|jgi:DamX protein|nr:SPOR domain-containing protein [Chromatiaceae bacterium]
MSSAEDTVSDKDPPDAIEARLLALEAQTLTQQSRLRDYEKALVERIADVDDDRRRAAAQLKRAIEAASGDQDQRLRSRTRWLLLGLVVALTLAVAGLTLAVYLDQERRQLAQDLFDLRQDVDRAAADVAGDQAVEGRLVELEARLAEMRGRLAAVDGEVERALAAAAAAERIARSEERARLSGEIERLENVQDDLATRLEVAQRELATRLDVALQGAAGDAVVGAAAVAPTVAPPEPMAADESSEGRIAPPAIEPAPPAESEPVAVVAVEDAAGAPAVAVDPLTPPPTLVTETAIYALQLIGFHELERLREFALDARLADPVWRLTERYRGRPWYPLIQGLYPDYAAAQAAVAQLPPALRGLDPWIRPLPAGTAVWTVDLVGDAPVPATGPDDPDTAP